MKFSKYSDIENSYRNNTIQHIISMGFDHGEWQVEEKCHGGNFSIWYDGDTFRCARRTDFLDENEKFNNWKKILEENKDAVIGIWNDLKDDSNDENVVVVYGELFGGSYSHPDVEKVPGSVKIQQGVQYTPDNLFYAFDIKYNGSYISLYDAENLFKRYDMFYARPLFRGTFEECMKYPNDEQSRIPEWLGLPKVENNISEGVVLKPIEAKYFGCGGRCILKNKNERWSEKTQKKKVKTSEPLSDSATTILEEISTYFSENRLKNVLSKIGLVTQKDFGKIMKDFQEDVYKDYKKDHDDNWETYDIDQLSDKEKKVVHKRACAVGTGLIRANFQNIIDGNF